MVFKTQFSKEFLISELDRFVHVHKRTPRYVDLNRKYGYPSAGTYAKQFGSLNNALLVANIPVNNYHKHYQDGTETCSLCGGKKIHQWNYNNYGDRICYKCYNSSKTKHKNGVLSHMSEVGKGFISQRIVAKCLEIPLENDCNCTFDFKSPYDLLHNEYGKIDVKASGLRTKYNTWQFYFKAKKEADTYICIAFNNTWKQIMRVWIIPNEGRYLDVTGISITNTPSSIEKYRAHEVNPIDYNNAMHSMSINDCPVLKNKE